MAQAEALYRDALTVNPRHAESLHRLGLIALAAGRAGAALPYLEKAIELQPRVAEFHHSRGNAFKELGRLVDAEAAYRRALTLRGRFPTALTNLGIVLLMLGRFAEAETCGRTAVRLTPDASEAHTLLGHALGALGRHKDAEARYRAAVRLQPGAPIAHNSLGHALSQLERAAEAEHCYREAIRLNPNFADAWNNLACCLRDLGRPREAEPCFREALRLRPDFVEALINFADTLYLLGRPAEAEAHARQAVQLRPTSAAAHNSLGCALRNLGQSAEAAACLREALRLRPDFPEAYNNLGSTLLKLGHWGEAESLFRAALCLRPDDPDVEVNLGGLMLAQGRYDEIIPQYRQVLKRNPASQAGRRGLLVALPYIPDAKPRDIFEIHCSLGAAAANRANPARLTNDRDTVRRLRVGWISCDFRNHPVGRNLELLFAHRNSAPFETFCYSDVKAADATTDWFRGHADQWRPVAGLEDAAVAELIHADRIDIMIYLAGRFDQNRPQLAAWRPAPVQISFHDVATSGFRDMDYLIADAALVPALTKELFTERALRLPNFYLHAPPASSPPPAPPPCLSNEDVMFGCFHNPLKLNPAVLALWAEILRRVPRSRLLFKYMDLFASEELRDRTCQRLGGNVSERIVFEPAQTAVDRHLALYNRIDIALDPFPFNGSTATFEALWMGVPVVTLAGDRMVSRWGASILTKVGLADLVAKSSEQYVDDAVRLASDHARLSELRRTLRDTLGRSALCDGPRAARHFERALRAVWRRWCRTQVTDSAGGRAG